MNNPPPATESLVVYVDIDAFFASVEQLLIPVLRNRPVVVGNGCIASCSYEARRFGLRAGMPIRQAVRMCPEAVVLDGSYPIYRCFAEGVWDVCRQYTCGLETFLDEAYGDAGGMERLYGTPMALGRALQRRVIEEVGLAVSVGLASNRMLAKLAGESVKPRGVACVPPGEEEAFVAPLGVEKLPGVGGATEQVLKDLNIRTAGELRALPLEFLRSMFGRRGEALYERCRGRDVGADIAPDRPPRTISRETAFAKPTTDRQEVRAMLAYLLDRAMGALREKKLLARRVGVYIRYDDGASPEAAAAMPGGATGATGEAFAVAAGLLEQLFARRVALRQVGVVLSSFSPASGEGLLFEAPSHEKHRRLDQAVDDIRRRYGHAAVVRGEASALLGRLPQNDNGFILRTPSLTK
ncbi:MAG: DNA polymerase IV [Planctomycetota bacterium]|nr:DNA polymerase IV [Planctomycetota bacterium]